MKLHPRVEKRTVYLGNGEKCVPREVLRANFND